MAKNLHHFARFVDSMVGGVLGLFLRPPTPDPWELAGWREDSPGDARPVCLNCLRPIDSPSQHYCPSCGNVTGEFTRYIPFVNIPFNYSIFATLWKKLRGAD